jgi:hypothetical protein
VHGNVSHPPQVPLVSQSEHQTMRVLMPEKAPLAVAKELRLRPRHHLASVPPARVLARVWLSVRRCPAQARRTPVLSPESSEIARTLQFASDCRTRNDSASCARRGGVRSPCSFRQGAKEVCPRKQDASSYIHVGPSRRVELPSERN